MPVNHFYDETAGHQVVVAPMAERRPLWRSALLGAYVELISMTQKRAKAAVDAEKADTHIDDLVFYGEIASIEPHATDELREGLVRYGFMEPTDAADVFRLVKHDKLAHWEPAKTLDWAKKNRLDRENKPMEYAMRFRDGDQCRVCHVVVKWDPYARKHLDEGATMDHVEPRVWANGDVDKVALVCRRCNAIRGNRRDANEVAPLQDPPEHPYYTKATADILREKGGYPQNKHGSRMTKTAEQYKLQQIPISARPATQADPAPQRDPATSGTPRTENSASEAPAGPLDASRPGTQSDTATSPARPATAADTAPRDPAASGTPRTPEVRAEFERSSPESQTSNFIASTPDPRTNRPPIPGGHTSGEGVGKVSGGGGDRRRRRAPRGRSARSAARRHTLPEE